MTSVDMEFSQESSLLLGLYKSKVRILFDAMHPVFVGTFLYFNFEFLSFLRIG